MSGCFAKVSFWMVFDGFDRIKRIWFGFVVCLRFSNFRWFLRRGILSKSLGFKVVALSLKIQVFCLVDQHGPETKRLVELTKSVHSIQGSKNKKQQEQKLMNIKRFVVGLR